MSTPAAGLHVMQAVLQWVFQYQPDGTMCCAPRGSTGVTSSGVRHSGLTHGTRCKLYPQARCGCTCIGVLTWFWRAAEYPFKAPLVRFETPCFHPNVDHHGNICLDILKEKWSAAYSVRTVLLSLQARAARRHRLEPVSGRASVLSRGAAACAVLRRAPSPWPAGS